MQDSPSLHELPSRWKLETFSSNCYVIYDILLLLYSPFALASSWLEPLPHTYISLSSFPHFIPFYWLTYPLPLFSQHFLGSNFMTAISKWKPCSSTKSSNLNPSLLLPVSHFHFHCVSCWIKMKHIFGKLMFWRAGRAHED